MNNKSRTKNTIRNFIVGFGGIIFQYTLSFITRTIFIYILPIQYLGVNGLFTNILAVLSLAELGIGGTFVSLLYKPLQQNDTEKLKSLMNTFKKTYMIIGFIVGAAGLALMPFLNILIKEHNIEHVPLIYLMFLTGSVASYFYAHKIVFVIADQRSYITTIYTQIFTLIQYIFQIAVLLLNGNFIIYLAIQILCAILCNYVLARKADSLYPFLKEKGKPLDQETLLDLKRKVIAGMYHYFGYVIVTGTDNIVISAFLGVFWVGVYSNYLLIIGVITAVVTMTFKSVSASVGNLIVSSDRIKTMQIFQNIQFINFLFVGFSSVCLVTLLNPFINIWIGSRYMLSQNIVVLIVVMFYISRDGMQKSINIFKNVSGLFYNDRYAGPLEGLINLILSLYLVQKLGIAGVFTGTIAAFMLTRLWVEPYIVYKNLFHTSQLNYYKKYLTYGIVTIATTAVVYYITGFIPHTTWIGFFAMAITCGILTTGIFVLLFFKTEEFNMTRDIIKEQISSRLNKQKGISHDEQSDQGMV